jgi:hypothetical protein
MALMFWRKQPNLIHPPAKIKRIRGSKLRVLVEGAMGVSFPKALELVDKEGLVIASNKRLDRVLIGNNVGETKMWAPCMNRHIVSHYPLPSEEYRELKSGFGCWTGTMVGYGMGGKKLGKYVIYTDSATQDRHVFPVPVQYRKEKNAILVVEHPDYALVKDGKDLVVAVWDENAVGLVRGFPPENARCLPDEKYGIPFGNEVHYENNSARFVWRNPAHVGPTYRFELSNGQIVDFTTGWNVKSGAIVEAPEKEFDEVA